MSTPLIIGPDEEAGFAALSKFAEEHPVDMGEIMEMIQTPEGKAKHVDRMTKQTMMLPFGFMVTYSVETGHPAGTCRHLSMSSPVPNRVPSPEAVWMVAQYLGFRGGLDACVVWEEELQRGRDESQVAMNIVQPVQLH